MPRSVEEMAREREELGQLLLGISASNTYGKTLDELTALRIQQINTLRRLNEVQREIEEYTHA